MTYDRDAKTMADYEADYARIENLTQQVAALIKETTTVDDEGAGPTIWFEGRPGLEQGGGDHAFFYSDETPAVWRFQTEDISPLRWPSGYYADGTNSTLGIYSTPEEVAAWVIVERDKVVAGYNAGELLPAK